MQKKILISLLLLTFLTGSALRADPMNDVAVIYSEMNEINRETAVFINEQFKRNKKNYNVKEFIVRDARNINFADYKAVLLLNTNVSSGIGRPIADYINSCKDKSKLIMVTLLKNNKELKIESIKPSPETLGVDAITGPSVWKDRGFLSYFGGSNPKEYDIHVEWLNHVLVLIEKM